MNPFQVVRDFERVLCEYTGAPFAVTTTSCTDALKLAVAWHLRDRPVRLGSDLVRLGSDFHSEGGPHLGVVTTEHFLKARVDCPSIDIPKRTYVGVPMAIIHAGGWPTFRDEKWIGSYQLKPLQVWDCARWFTSGMYKGEIYPPQKHGDTTYTFGRDAAGSMACVSFHWSKTLGIQQGGAILHDNPEADRWLRMARFDGRQEGVAPKDQKEWIIGHHCYMSPETAAAGLVRLHHLPRHNAPLPDDDYPDLTTLGIF